MSQPSQSSNPSAGGPSLKRRAALGAGGAVAGLAAAAALLPSGTEPTSRSSDTASSESQDANGRYQLTEHIKRYYQTTRV